MVYRRILLIALMAVMTCLGLSAQTVTSTLKMKLTDSLSGEPVPFATIFVSKDGTSQGRFYAAVTDADGNGAISGIPAGKYVLTADLMGYKKLIRDVNLKGGVTDLGEVLMQPDIAMLDEVVVTAVGNPIVVKKDTIEYSAAAYKTTDNDVLEDLLKKLPGVEVDSDGAITYQGETINKIMIDGKEFFLDDPSLASKNIPAQIIQKVKIVDKKSDQAEFTGIDDGNEE